MTSTQIETTAARLWKRLPESVRLSAAEAFWQDEDGLDQQIEAMSMLARHLKARPKFIAGLPVARRARYLAAYPGMPETLAARLLVSYHLARQRPMLKTFLDALEVPHEDGLITADQPGPVSEDRLDKAVQALDAAFPAADVTTYLQTLLVQDPETWGSLAKLPQTQRALA